MTVLAENEQCVSVCTVYYMVGLELSDGLHSRRAASWRVLNLGSDARDGVKEEVDAIGGLEGL